MKRFALFINLQKPEASELAVYTRQLLKQKGVEAVVPAGKDGYDFHATAEQLAHLSGKVDCALVFGGDGSILSVARSIGMMGVPILGINFGRMGFLAETEPEDIHAALDALMNNRYHLERRMMLQGKLMRQDKQIASFMALNDIVVTHTVVAHTINMEIRIKGQTMATYPADGLIVATPTGSTAYSLSAGGPIVDPQMDLLMINPVCAHILHSRPMVINPREEIEIVYHSKDGNAQVIADGQGNIPLQNGDHILVARAEERALLVKFAEDNFYNTLNRKLRERSSRYD